MPVGIDHGSRCRSGLEEFVTWTSGYHLFVLWDRIAGLGRQGARCSGRSTTACSTWSGANCVAPTPRSRSNRKCSTCWSTCSGTAPVSSPRTICCKRCGRGGSSPTRRWRIASTRRGLLSATAENSQTLIRTLPRKGFRFVGNVTEERRTIRSRAARHGVAAFPAGAALARRAAVHGHQSGSAAQPLRRRNYRGPDHRAGPNSMAVRDRAEFRVRLQEPARRRETDLARARRALCPRGQRPALGATHQDHRAAHRRDDRRASMGRALRQGCRRDIRRSGRDCAQRGGSGRTASAGRRRKTRRVPLAGRPRRLGARCARPELSSGGSRNPTTTVRLRV